MEKLEKVVDLWNSYRRDVVPADASTIQVIECQRAFYAGVAALFDIATSFDDSVPEEEIEAYLHRVADELEAFKNAVLASALFRKIKTGQVSH